MDGVLQGKHIVLGVTGGIAAYKACELTSRLRKAGADVHVIMTHNAEQFVGKQTFETLSANPVCTDTFKREAAWEVEHVALAKQADLFVIAPATANIIGKMASGIADDMLSTTVMAASCNVLLAPAMNTGMWQNAAVQSNVALLKSRGILFEGPEGGYLACGDSGTGRMSEPETLFERCVSILCAEKDLAGLKVLVTAGPTREALDPVRFITNHSSGKMGCAIAERAHSRGAEVTLVLGPSSIAAPAGVKKIDVVSTQDLCDVMTAEAPGHDIVIQAAAPADFTPVAFSGTKIKKEKSDTVTFEFRKTPDVAKTIGKLKKAGQTFVGFAAETDSIEQNALKKLDSKNLDMIVANNILENGAGFGVDTNIITMYTHTDSKALPLMSKKDAADAILDKVKELRSEK